MAKLTGKVALITGAAVGLGEGIATAYAKYGAKLCMVDLSPEVEKTAEKLRKEYNAEIVTCVANVADPAQTELVFDTPAGQRRLRLSRIGLHRWLHALHMVLRSADWADWPAAPDWLTRSYLPPALQSLLVPPPADLTLNDEQDGDAP